MTEAVLVVDDEEAVRSSEADILRAAGYDVAEAADGFEALDLLRSRPMDAVVLDVRMPGCTGLEVVARLDDPPPIVMVSAHTLADDDLAQVADKVDAVLTKPVPPRRLIEQVRLALRREGAP